MIGGGGRGIKKNFPSAHRMLKLKGLVGSLQARVLDKRIERLLQGVLGVAR